MTRAVTDQQLTLELTLGAETRLQGGLRSLTTCTLEICTQLNSLACNLTSHVCSFVSINF